MKSLFLIAFAFLLCLISPVAAADPAIVRVRLDTSMGPIILGLDARHAPQTVQRFLEYVDDGRLDDTRFYRASRAKWNPNNGLVQGGIGTDIRRRLPPPLFEPTSRTGLTHKDGTISMARGDDPAYQTCNFSIMVGPHPSLDAKGEYQGYAAFGQVISGMNVVKRMMAQQTGGGTGVMRGQMLLAPIRIIRAVRLDGVARPTGRPKPWLLMLPQRKPRR